MAETRAVTKAEVAMVREKAKSLGLRVKKVHRRISMEEFDERYSKWLCMFCGEQETPDHHLQHKNEVILVIDCGEEQLPVVDDEMATQLQLQKELQSPDVLLEEKSTPQSQVPIANSEILKSIEPGKVDLGLEKLEHVVMNENLEQEWDQKNDNKEIEVDGDIERDQKMIRDAKICCAHKVFGKMPSKEKRIKHLKGWKFKFKRKSLVGIMLQIEQCKLWERRRRMYNKVSTNIKDEAMKERIAGNHQRMSHRKHKWKSKIYGCETEKHMLLRVNLASRVWEHGELFATHLYGKLFGIKTLIVLGSYRWEYKKQLKSEKRSFQRTYAAQIKRCEETARQICFFTDQMSKPRVLAKQILVKEYDIDLDNVEAGSKEHSHESFGTKGLAYDGCVILGMNFAGFGRSKAELLATSQRMQRIDFFLSCCSCTNQIFVAIHTEIEENLEFNQLLAAVERFSREVIEEWAKRIVIEQKIEGCLIRGDVKFHLKHKWRFRLFQSFSRLVLLALINLWLSKTHAFSGQLQDLRRGEAESFPLLNFAAEPPLLWMENKSEPVLTASAFERKKKKLCSKTWTFKYKVPHLDEKIFETSDQCIRKRGLVSADQETEDNQLILRSFMWVIQNCLNQYMVLLLASDAYDAQFSVGVGMNKKQLRLSLRNNRVWDPGGSLVDAATPGLLSLHFTALHFIAAILSFFKKTLRSRFLQRREI